MRGAAICGLVSGIAATCSAQAQPVGAENLRAFWSAATTKRVDVVQLGDSTQLYEGHGWDEAWTRVMHERFGLFATGIHSAGENGGNGAGVGWECATASTLSQGQFAYSGAPPLIEATCGPGLIPLGYLFVPAGSTALSTANGGMSLTAANPLGLSGPLRFHYRYARFDTDAPGSFRPVVRLDSSPYTNLFSAADILTGGGPALEAGVIDIPPGERGGPLAFRWTQSGGPAIRGPFFGSWMRVERSDRPTGMAVTTLYAAGGRTARDAASALLNVDDATLGSLLSMVRSMQQAPVRCLFRVSFGVNDRNETRASVGPGAYLPGNSRAAFEENVRAVMSRIEQVWVRQGWDLSEVFFVLTVSAPISDPDDEKLVSYRDATDAIAAAVPRVASLRLDRLTSESEMLANGWYKSSTDHFHLSRPGFAALSDREVTALLSAATTLGMTWRTIDGGGVTVSRAGGLEMSATISQPDAAELSGGGMAWFGGFWGGEVSEAPCPADYNRDGGIDGADVQAFFIEWEEAMPRADVNGDGGIDGADVEYFFAVWEAGGC